MPTGPESPPSLPLSPGAEDVVVRNLEELYEGADGGLVRLGRPHELKHDVLLLVDLVRRRQRSGLGTEASPHAVSSVGLHLVPRLVGGDRAHHDVERHVDRGQDLSLPPRPKHLDRGDQDQPVARLDLARLVRVAAVDEIIDHHAAARLPAAASDAGGGWRGRERPWEIM